MPTDGRIKFPKSLWLCAHLTDEMLYFVVKAVAEFEGDVRVVLHRLDVFFIGFGMKNMRLHR